MIAIEQRNGRTRLIGWRVYAISLAVVLVLSVMASGIARVGDVAATSTGADDCVQRVRDWSPSRQAYITRVHSFCD